MAGSELSALKNQEAENQPTTVYLPLIQMPPRVAPLQFAAQLDNEGNPVSPATTFQYGIRYLYVVTTVENGVGSKWGIKWTLNDKYLSELDLEGVISGSPERVTDSICGLVQSSPPRCEALPRGTYRVDFFLNDQLYHTGTAVIR